MTDALKAGIPDRLEAAVLELLKKANQRDVRLATAESCTGGLLASLMTDVEGYSHVFDSGVVAYSGEAKVKLLDVSPDMLKRFGPVSAEVALAMAEGVLAHSVADIAVGVTGFAGPAGENDEEGLVHLACMRRDSAVCHREMHFGSIGRDGVRLEAAQVAIEMMSETL